jgi:glycosyltransferase involved in cell wall biosynthesis
MTLSLVIPVYRNEASLPDLLAAVSDLQATCPAPLEVVFVVDGSPDQSADILIRELAARPYPSQVLSLSRNFGSFAAIRAGLAASDADAYAVMAADLQEPPELIIELSRRVSQDDYDVAVGVREGRADPWPTRLASAGFWAFYRTFVQREIPKGGADIFACTRAVRDQLLALPERNTSLIGLLFWLGFRRAEVPYRRLARRAGKGAWTWSRRVRYFLDSLFAFTDLPLRLLSLTGALGMGLAVGFGFVVLWARLAGRIDVPGYAATVLVVMFFGGLNSLSLGLVGEYIWRTFENTKGRPPYIVARRVSFSGASHQGSARSAHAR